jgi:predicted RNase H-like nuclease
MTDEPLHQPKSTWVGIALRRHLMERKGIEVPLDIGQAGEAGVSDVLDAAAAAWSADRVARGIARSLPDDPEAGQDGHTPAIWY